MNVDAIVTATISGAFSIASAFGSIWLKDYLERRRTAIAPRAAAASASPAGVGMRTPPPASLPSPAPSARHFSFVLVPILLLVGGFLIGIVSRAIREQIRGPIHYEAIVSFALLAAICLWLALANRGSRGFWPYQLDILALYTAFASGWSVANARIWSDLVGLVFFYWVGSAIVGGIIVAVPKRSAV